MKKALLFLLTVFTVYSSYEQIPYYDAFTLKKYLSPNNGELETVQIDAFKSILSTYNLLKKTAPVTKGNEQHTFSEYMEANPFLDDYKDVTVKITGGFGASLDIGNTGTAVLSSLGGLDVTSIADGLAKFLVARTKEELSVAFFSNLKTDLEDQKYVAIKTLFPLTFQQLEAIGGQIYQYSIYLTDLRNAFCSDLNNLATTIPYVITLPQYNSYFNAHRWVSGIIQTGLLIGSSIIQTNNTGIMNVSNVIDMVYSKVDTYFPVTSGDTISSNINGTIKTLHLISSSLRSSDASRTWVSSSDFFVLINDDAAFKIYLGLVYQNAKNDNIVFSGGYRLTQVFDAIGTKALIAQKFKAELSSLNMQMNLYDQDFQNLKTMPADNSGKTTYLYSLFNTSTSIFSQGMSILKNINGTGLLLPAGFFDHVDDYVKGLQDISNGYLNINQKRFALAISSAADFFSIVLAEVSTKDKNVAKVIQRLNTYGTFIAQVANAKTSTEVDSIINNTVLPTGSAYIKKNSRFNIALQAYTGLYGGYQRQATDTKFVGAAGVYAPVGLAVSWGLPGCKNNSAPGSISIFASIIDIGPFVSFRFTDYNSAIANNVNVRLSQIVSPGLHLVYGIPKLPLSFGVGCNWAPLITDVEKDAITTDNKNAFRYQAFIAVDIPFLNFYNSPR